MDSNTADTRQKPLLKNLVKFFGLISLFSFPFSPLVFGDFWFFFCPSPLLNHFVLFFSSFSCWLFSITLLLFFNSLIVPLSHFLSSLLSLFYFCNFTFFILPFPIPSTFTSITIMLISITVFRYLVNTFLLLLNSFLLLMLLQFLQFVGVYSMSYMFYLCVYKYSYLFYG